MENLSGDNMDYLQYPRTKKAIFEKTMNTLKGLIEGIKADQSINQSEIEELQNWCLLQTDHRKRYPFMEIIPLIETSISDGVLTQDEIDDILWLCNNYLHTNPYYNVLTSDMHELQGIVHGILSDNKINETELIYLKNWLDDYHHLESLYPYDEIYSMIHKVMQDGKIDQQEELMLKSFFSEFVDSQTSLNINIEEYKQIKSEMNIQGICALAPNIEIEGKLFCFTGESSRLKRSELAEVVTSRGGKFHNNVVKETNYLIVGDSGNPCWAFACYGRKVEKAISLRKQGLPIIIAHEVDFWDALA